MKKLIYLITLSFIITSCGSTKGLYSWDKYEQASYNYLKKADDKSTEKIMEQYIKVLNKQKGTRKIAPPGMYADYGYFLIQRGNLKEGKANLMREIVLYPESKIFIDRILKLIEE
tara:strand:- start:3462 stop:3806 length:345 start_codon:yes stop_codon:yes gene_type:complete